MMVAGTLLSAVTVARPPSLARIATVRRWDRFVTGPAIGGAWLLGIALAFEGGWFHSGWLPVKLVFVLILSGLHGMLAGSLKRLERGEPTLAFLRFSPVLVVGCVLIIGMLVGTKPF